MGKVTVTARIEDLEDSFDAEKGLIAPNAVRSVEVDDALVDTGATGLLLPRSMIARLGLRPLRVRQARGLGGSVPMPSTAPSGSPSMDATGQLMWARSATSSRSSSAEPPLRASSCQSWGTC